MPKRKGTSDPENKVKRVARNVVNEKKPNYYDGSTDDEFEQKPSKVIGNRKAKGTRAIKKEVKGEKSDDYGCNANDEFEKKPKCKVTADTSTKRMRAVRKKVKQEKSDDYESNIDDELQKKPKLEVTDDTETKSKRKKTAISAVKEENYDDCGTSSNDKFEPYWKEYELLEERHKLATHVAKNLNRLFEDGNEIPFIARYRKNETQNMSPEELRNVKDTYEEICALKARMNTILKALIRLNKLDGRLKQTILNTTSIEELEYTYAPYKPGSKRNLAERAKELGLEEPAMRILENRPVDFSSYVKPDNPDIDSEEKVQKGICNILASIIASDTDLLKHIKPM